MKRVTPDRRLAYKPCLITALTCAIGRPSGKPELKDGGFATLASANRWIRSNTKVKRRIDFRRGQRPSLKDLHLDGRGVVCVYGHYIYVDHETYWSFFKNRDDEVVTVWLLDDMIGGTR